MYSIISLLAFLHLLGALIAAIYATWGEIAYMHAAEDGTIDHRERKYLRKLFRGLHVGITLVVLTSIALIVIEYLISDPYQAVLAAPFWASMTLALLVLVFGWLLSKRAMQWWFGSPAILVALWMLVDIDLGGFNSWNYIAILMLWLLVSFLASAVLGYLRLWLWKPKKISAD